MKEIQLYGRTNMTMLNEHNKIYGSLGIREAVKTITKIAKGTGQVVLTEGIKAPFEKFELSGNSKQTSTTGKNLFDISKFPFEHDAEMIVIKPSEGQTSVDKGINITEDIKFEENTQYVISYDSYNVTQANENWTTIFTFYYTDGTYRDLYVNHFYGNLKKYFNSDSGKTIRNVAVRNPWKVGIEISKVQIEKGNVATDYEPYTGGKPSPSPEYPQEIVSAGKYDETSGKYLVDVNVTGKNLINEEHFFDLRNWTKNLYPVQLVPNTKYTFSRRDNSGYKSGMFLQIKRTVEGVLSQIINTNSELSCKQKVTFTTNETGLIEFQILNTTNINFKDMLGYAQLEKSDVPTPYEPYHEPQTVRLQLEKPLTKWDRLEKREGVWGIARQSVREELTQYNFDTYILPSGSYPTGVYCYATKKSNAVLENQSSFCTHFKNSNYAYSITNAKVGIYSDHGRVPYKYFVSDKPTVDEFKAWLVQQKEAGTPVELVYKTAEETWEPLPEETQLALENLHANDGTTIITVDSGEVETGIEVHYKSYGNNVRGAQ